ncbi:MAG TPA: hypothetical protein VIY48_00265 [Candidatus Paceibacterota bacterium]
MFEIFEINIFEVIYSIEFETRDVKGNRVVHRHNFSQQFPAPDFYKAVEVIPDIISEQRERLGKLNARVGCCDVLSVVIK